MSIKARTSSGFTIVELLIVIVVISILAALTVVGYVGIQQRARDSDRKQDFAILKKALELYKVDNNGYPQCDGSTHLSGTGGSGGTVSACLSSSLVPKYIAVLPQDPINTTGNGTFVYHYAVGYKKTGATTYTYDMTSNYVLAVKLESQPTPTFSGWSYTDLSMLDGS